MTTLNPDHLLEQALGLIAQPQARRPRQVDLRRGISSAYYATFHYVITAAADEIVGISLRHTREHSLVMCSIDHKTIKTCCVEITKPTPGKNYLPYVPPGGFASQILAFADLFPDLQDERHTADYDSLATYATADARGIVANAGSALNQLRAAAPEDRKPFLYLLLFPPKR